MAKIILETDVLGGEISFHIDELLSIVCMDNKIVLFFKDRVPVYIPMTPGNFAFFERMAPYFSKMLLDSVHSGYENLRVALINSQKT